MFYFLKRPKKIILKQHDKLLFQQGVLKPTHQSRRNIQSIKFTTKNIRNKQHYITTDKQKIGLSLTNW